MAGRSGGAEDQRIPRPPHLSSGPAAGDPVGEAGLERAVQDIEDFKAGLEAPGGEGDRVPHAPVHPERMGQTLAIAGHPGKPIVISEEAISEDGARAVQITEEGNAVDRGPGLKVGHPPYEEPGCPTLSGGAPVGPERQVMASVVDGVGPLIVEPVCLGGVKIDVFGVVPGAGPDPARLKAHAPGGSAPDHRMQGQVLATPTGIGGGQATTSRDRGVHGAKGIPCLRGEIDGVGGGAWAFKGVQVPRAWEVPAFHPEAIHRESPGRAQLHPPTQGGLARFGLLEPAGEHAAFLARREAPLECRRGGLGGPLSERWRREVRSLKGDDAVAIRAKLHRVGVDGVGEMPRVDPPTGPNRHARGWKPVCREAGLEVVQVGCAFTAGGDVIVVPAHPGEECEIGARAPGVLKKSPHQRLPQIHLLGASIQAEADHSHVGRNVPNRDERTGGANVALIDHRVGAPWIGIGAQELEAAVQDIGTDPEGVGCASPRLEDIAKLDLTFALVKDEVGRTHHGFDGGKVGAYDGDLGGREIAGRRRKVPAECAPLQREGVRCLTAAQGAAMGQAREGAAADGRDVGLGYDDAAPLAHPLDITQGQPQGGGLAGGPAVVQARKATPGRSKLRPQKVGLGGGADPILALIAPFEGDKEEGAILDQGPAQGTPELEAPEAVRVDPGGCELGRGVEGRSRAPGEEEFALPDRAASPGLHAHHAIGAPPQSRAIGGCKDLKPGERRQRKLHARAAQKALLVVEPIDDVGGVEGIVARDGERGRISKKRRSLRDAGHSEGEGQRVSCVGGEGLDFGGLEGPALRCVFRVQEGAGPPPDHRDGVKLVERHKNKRDGANLARRQRRDAENGCHHPLGFDDEFARDAGGDDELKLAEGIGARAPGLAGGGGGGDGRGRGREPEDGALEPVARLRSDRALKGGGGLGGLGGRTSQGFAPEDKKHGAQAQGRTGPVPQGGAAKLASACVGSGDHGVSSAPRVCGGSCHGHGAGRSGMGIPQNPTMNLMCGPEAVQMGATHAKDAQLRGWHRFAGPPPLRPSPWGVTREPSFLRNVAGYRGTHSRRPCPAPVHRVASPRMAYLFTGWRTPSRGAVPLHGVAFAGMGWPSPA